MTRRPERLFRLMPVDAHVCAPLSLFVVIA